MSVKPVQKTCERSESVADSVDAFGDTRTSAVLDTRTVDGVRFLPRNDYEPRDCCGSTKPFRVEHQFRELQLMPGFSKGDRALLTLLPPPHSMGTGFGGCG